MTPGPLGAVVRADLDSTPSVLMDLLEPLDPAATALAPLLREGRTWLVGCGSSHLVGGAVAEVLGRAGAEVVAVTASELLDGLPGPPPGVAVLVSRSGRTSETVAAAGALRVRGARLVAVVCEPTSPLADLADDVVDLVGAGESGIAQTRSVLAALELGLLLAARVDGRDGRAEVATSLETIEDDAVRRAGHWTEVAERTVTRGGRVHVLGGGARWWLAREIALKGWEMGRADVRAERVLEVPHGPVEAFGPADTVVALADPGRGRKADLEAAVLERVRPLVAEVHVLPSTSLLDQLHEGHHVALALATALGVDADAPARLTSYIQWTQETPS